MQTSFFHAKCQINPQPVTAKQKENSKKHPFLIVLTRQPKKLNLLSRNQTSRWVTRWPHCVGKHPCMFHLLFESNSSLRSLPSDNFQNLNLYHVKTLDVRLLMIQVEACNQMPPLLSQQMTQLCVEH